MIYKFRIVSDEVDNFKRVIAIDADDTFESLRNAILESVDYTKDQMDSFFICDEDWSKRTEITLAYMGSESDEDIWIMGETRLSELIDDEGQKLIFVFDYLTDRAFFMEMREMIPGKDLKDPVCEKKEGKAAPQFVDVDELNDKRAAVQAASLDDDLDADFYGTDEFNDDEFDADGFDDFKME